jgi:hypothetical protein
MLAPNPLAARRRTNSSSFSVAVPSSWEESVVSGAIANRFAISRPLLNLKGDQTAIDQTSDILKLGGIEWIPARHQESAATHGFSKHPADRRFWHSASRHEREAVWLSPPSQ